MIINDISFVWLSIFVYFADVAAVFDSLKSATPSFQSFCSAPHSNFKSSSQSLNQISDGIDLNSALENESETPVKKEIIDQINFTDKILYIYTSGTTGLPKAAVIKHSR